MNSIANAKHARAGFHMVAVITVLIVVLIGGMLHNHRDPKQAAACTFCHAGIQPPVQNLAEVLAAPSLKVVGAACSLSGPQLAPVPPVLSVPPRSPPHTA